MLHFLFDQETSFLIEYHSAVLQSTIRDKSYNINIVSFMKRMTVWGRGVFVFVCLLYHQ
jgi:hypothetical protein